MDGEDLRLLQNKLHFALIKNSAGNCCVPMLKFDSNYCYIEILWSGITDTLYCKLEVGYQPNIVLSLLPSGNTYISIFGDEPTSRIPTIC